MFLQKIQLTILKLPLLTVNNLYFDTEYQRDAALPDLIDVSTIPTFLREPLDWFGKSFLVRDVPNCGFFRVSSLIVLLGSFGNPFLSFLNLSFLFFGFRTNVLSSIIS